MNYLLRRSFSTVREQLQKLRDSNICNVPENILALADKKLLTIENHPLCIIKEQIKKSLGPKFTVFMTKIRVFKI